MQQKSAVLYVAGRRPMRREKMAGQPWAAASSRTSSECSSRMIMPVVMQESATLNAGQ